MGKIYKIMRNIFGINNLKKNKKNKLFNAIRDGKDISWYNPKKYEYNEIYFINGNTPLHYACMKNNKSAVNYLLKNGADIDKYNKNKQKVIHVAIVYSDISIIKMLIKYGASLYEKCENGENFYHIASYFSRVEIIKFLAEETKLDVNKKNIFNKSPIESINIIYVSKLIVDTIETLLNVGTDVSIINDDYRKKYKLYLIKKNNL